MNVNNFILSLIQIVWVNEPNKTDEEKLELVKKLSAFYKDQAVADGLPF